MDTQRYVSFRIWAALLLGGLLFGSLLSGIARASEASVAIASAAPGTVLFAGGDEFACFIFSIILIVAGVTILHLVSKAQGRNDAFDRIAQQYDGTLRRGGFLTGFPKVLFQHQGTRVEVSLEPRGWTQLRLTWNQPDFSCVIEPRAFWNSVNQVMTGSGMKTGNPRFDRIMNVRCLSNNQSRAREFLSAPVQSQILKFLQLGSNRFSITASHHSLTIRIRKSLTG
ncbi:MAG: hypothetical protein N2C14_01810, partial [Planctomycetales bacterium]